MMMLIPTEVTSSVLTATNVTNEAAWNSGTTYADAALVDYNDHTWESLQASNLNKVPGATGSELWWLDLGANNKWSAHDETVESQATRADSLYYEYTLPAGRFANAIAALNASAGQIQIEVHDGATLVYDETYEMTDFNAITDGYEYCFLDVPRKTDFMVSDLPFYGGAKITITLTDTGSDVLVGEIIPGVAQEIGDTQYGSSIGIRDRSIKETDEFGRAAITRRSYSRRGNFAVLVTAGRVDSLVNTLATYRATPIVYQGSDAYGATIIYGYYKDFTVGIEYWNYSMLNIEIEGLV